MIGNGAGLGSSTRAYEIFDYLVWFLSSERDWLPRNHHTYLLQGMKDWALWLWGSNDSYSPDPGAPEAAFHEWIFQKDIDKTTVSTLAADDLFDRVDYSRRLLRLPEPTQSLMDRFLYEHIIEAWMTANEQRVSRRQRPKQP